jgi:hypothetical protein
MVAMIERMETRMPQVSFEEVTPERATEYLAHNTRNRRIDRGTVSRYVRSMRAGQWRQTGESIQIDMNGNIVDGQHRLKAIEESGVAITLLVCRNVAPEVRDVVDTGRRRTMSDRLTLDGVPSASTVAASLRWAWRYDYGLMKGKSVTPEHWELAACLDEHPDIKESSGTYNILEPSGLLPAGLAAWLHYACTRAEPALGERFFDAIGHGENISKGETAFTTRRLLLQDRASRGTMTGTRQIMLAAYVAKGWNYYAVGTNVSRFEFDPTKPFPIIWGCAPKHV